MMFENWIDLIVMRKQGKYIKKQESDAVSETQSAIVTVDRLYSSPREIHSFAGL